MTDNTGGFMAVKMRRGDIVRLGDQITIELKKDGSEVARITISAPIDVPIIIERGIQSPFHKVPQSDIR